MSFFILGDSFRLDLSIFFVIISLSFISIHIKLPLTLHIIFNLTTGMSQASSDCMLPNVIVRRNFMKFVMDEMDDLFPSGEYHRIIAHPPSDSIDAHPIRVRNLSRECSVTHTDTDLDSDSNSNSQGLKSSRMKKIVVAVGPEGGWEDGEVLLLLSKGFSLVSLGPRILRTDMAVSVLLGLAHDWTDNDA